MGSEAEIQCHRSRIYHLGINIKYGKKEISQFFVEILEQYSGLDHSISWTVLGTDTYPVHWLELKKRPELNSFLTMSFWEEHGWVEVHRETKSLHSSEPINDVSIIQIEDGVNWQGAIRAIIQSWLELD